MALPKLIACDLDGTLLLDGAQSLRPDTCDIIRALREKGVLFFAASGRQHTNLQRLFAPIRDEIGYLCENGCIGFFEGKKTHREKMDRALGQRIIRAIMDTDGAEVTVAGESLTYICPKGADFLPLLRDVVHYDVSVVENILNTPEDYMKISVYERAGVGDGAKWHRAFDEHCTVVESGLTWIDMMPKNVNKGSGLRRILDTLGIEPENCMAIGDNDNDREMLALVGMPVAMRTAKPHIRAMADRQTDTVEHLLQDLLSGKIGL